MGRVDFADGGRRFYVNIADCGMGGEVVAHINRSTLKRGGVRGSAMFLTASLSTLLSYESRVAQVEIDADSSSMRDGAQRRRRQRPVFRWRACASRPAPSSTTAAFDVVDHRRDRTDSRAHRGPVAVPRPLVTSRAPRGGGPSRSSGAGVVRRRPDAVRCRGRADRDDAGDTHRACPVQAPSSLCAPPSAEGRRSMISC